MANVEAITKRKCRVCENTELQFASRTVRGVRYTLNICLPCYREQRSINRLRWYWKNVERARELNRAWSKAYYYRKRLAYEVQF